MSAKQCPKQRVQQGCGLGSAVVEFVGNTKRNILVCVHSICSSFMYLPREVVGYTQHAVGNRRILLPPAMARGTFYAWLAACLVYLATFATCISQIISGHWLRIATTLHSIRILIVALIWIGEQSTVERK